MRKEDIFAAICGRAIPVKVRTVDGGEIVLRVRELSSGELADLRELKLTDRERMHATVAACTVDDSGARLFA